MFPWKKWVLCSPWRLLACPVPAATGTGCWSFVPSPALCLSTRMVATIRPTSTINSCSDSKEPCPKPSYILFARASKAAKRNKARRGELRFPLPVGYVYGEEPGSVLIDPDQEIRSAVELIFELFRQTGSAYGVVRHFAQHKLRFPKRSYGGVWNGKLLWGNLKHSRVLGVLNNPCYAGAYVFGRFKSSKSLSSDGQIRSRVLEQPIDSWSVLIQDHHCSYISWQQYLENQQILSQKPNQQTRAAV